MNISQRTQQDMQALGITMANVANAIKYNKKRGRVLTKAELHGATAETILGLFEGLPTEAALACDEHYDSAVFVDAAPPVFLSIVYFDLETDEEVALRLIKEKHTSESQKRRELAELKRLQEKYNSTAVTDESTEY